MFNKELIINTKKLLSISSETPFGENVDEKYAECVRAMNLCSNILDDMGAKFVNMEFAGDSEKWPYPVPNLYGEINICNNTKDNDEFILYMGHIDVVPPGDINAWTSNPFEAREENGFLYARGATDMKASVMSFLMAMKDFAKKKKNKNLKIGVAITGDEEWAAVNGSDKILRCMKEQGLKPTKVIVGEPSSREELGTNIKVGRRGSLIGRVSIKGNQGHRAYPDLYSNPNRLFPFVNMILNSLQWNDGNEFMANTDLEVNAIDFGNLNHTSIIPGSLEAMYSVRFTDKQKPEDIVNTLNEAIFFKHPEFVKSIPGYDYYRNHLSSISLIANLNSVSLPYYSEPNVLANLAQEVIKEKLKIDAKVDAFGGATDGRFVHKYFPDAEIIELGLPENGGLINGINPDVSRGGMHQIDERASITDIEGLHDLYVEILNKLSERNTVSIQRKEGLDCTTMTL